jgi:hypothetical protein
MVSNAYALSSIVMTQNVVEVGCVIVMKEDRGDPMMLMTYKRNYGISPPDAKPALDVPVAKLLPYECAVSCAARVVADMTSGTIIIPPRLLVDMPVVLLGTTLLFVCESSLLCQKTELLEIVSRNARRDALRGKEAVGMLVIDSALQTSGPKPVDDGEVPVIRPPRSAFATSIGRMVAEMYGGRGPE